MFETLIWRVLSRRDEVSMGFTRTNLARNASFLPCMCYDGPHCPCVKVHSWLLFGLPISPVPTTFGKVPLLLSFMAYKISLGTLVGESARVLKGLMAWLGAYPSSFGHEWDFFLFVWLEVLTFYGLLLSLPLSPKCIIGRALFSSCFEATASLLLGFPSRHRSTYSSGGGSVQWLIPRATLRVYLSLSHALAWDMYRWSIACLRAAFFQLT